MCVCVWGGGVRACARPKRVWVSVCADVSERGEGRRRRRGGGVQIKASFTGCPIVSIVNAVVAKT